MKEPAKIAFVCPRYAEGGTVGGAETLLRSLAERLAQAGREVSFLTTCAKSHFTWENAWPAGVRRLGNLDVHFFPVDDRDAGRFLGVQEVISRHGAVTREDEEAWIANSVNSAALYEFLRSQGGAYDRIILGPYLFGLTWFASRLWPKKSLLVPCLHDEPFAHLEIMRDMFGAVRGFLFNSEPEQELAQRLFGIAGDRCAVVGIGLELFEVEAGAFARRHGIKQPYVIYSGRREGGKGTPLLTAYLSAFRARTGMDIKLVFTGSGPIEAPADMMAHILDVGFVSEQEKHEAMAGAQVFVHPSTFESLGIVLLESFLAGTPALVHHGSEVLRWQCRRSGAGLWFRSYAEFEEELLLLLRQDELRRNMGRRGREYVRKEYAWDAVERRLDQALAGL